jgi:putative endonuclease
MMEMMPEAREELVSGSVQEDPGISRQALRGQTNYRFGHAAEGQVEGAYLRTGHRLRNRRWRGGVGEIDLVMEKAKEIVFVEVKASRTHERAAASLSRRPDRPPAAKRRGLYRTIALRILTPMRFDVALVDGRGRVDVIENALAA